jgi:IS5 family transposase
VTTGSVHDAKVMHHLIREDDTAVYGDKGYASERRKEVRGRTRGRAVGGQGEGEAGA